MNPTARLVMLFFGLGGDGDGDGDGLGGRKIDFIIYY
jgi:hypothetical protein